MVSTQLMKYLPEKIGICDWSLSQAVAARWDLAHAASTKTEAQMTAIASVCQGVRVWLRNITAKKAAITGLRKKR